MSHTLFIGTSGYTYKDWRGLFYPKGVAQKDWLAFFARHYDTVEINATFYRSFPSSVYERWRDVTPEGFCFTLKGPRPVTHDKRLVGVEEEVRAFDEQSRVLGDKRSAMLWQFPPSFANTDETRDHLAHFLTLLPRGVRQAIEFRHKTWFQDAVYDLLNAQKAGFVINDSSRWAAREVVTGDFAYVRFHGPGKLYASLYTPEQLEAWAKKIRGYLAERDVYVYFNNDYGGRALQNANELRAMLTRAE
jgi:uncharacterized protein YecE (DUF72 family)